MDSVTETKFPVIFEYDLTPFVKTSIAEAEARFPGVQFEASIEMDVNLKIHLHLYPKPVGPGEKTQ